MTNRAKCGCAPGEFLCPEAEDLWFRCRMFKASYLDYSKARAAYDAHMAKARKEMECSSLR